MIWDWFKAKRDKTSAPNSSMNRGMSLRTDSHVIADHKPLLKSLGEPLLDLGDSKSASFITYQLPDLWLPSGRIVCCDGLIFDGSPFTQAITPGRYPLYLFASVLGDDERISFALVRFSEEPVARWQLAVTNGQDASTLGEDEVFGYGVDTGTGCFCDAGAFTKIEKVFDPEMKFFNSLTEQMKTVYKHTRDWVTVETDHGSAAIFSSGYGDGLYASYFGFDEKGNVAQLLTDFALVDWPRRPKVHGTAGK